MSDAAPTPTPVGRSVVIYALAFAVAGGTPFLLLPFLTRHLSPEAFGEVAAFVMLATLCGNVAGLSAHGFVSVRFFKTPAGPFKSLVSTSMWSIVVAHGVATLLLGLLYPLLESAFDLPFGYTVFAGPAALFLNANLIFLAIFQSSGQPLMYLRARLVQGVLELSLCVGLVTLVVADAGSRIFTWAAALAASALVGWLYSWRRGHIGGGFDREHLRGLFSFGVPMLPHIVAGSAISYLDRLMVSSLLGTESLGIYMVAMQIGLAMMALVEPLNKALAPWLFEQLAKNDEAVRVQIVKRTYLLYAALALIGVVVAGVAWLLFDQVIGEKFRPARALIPWMVAAFVVQGMYYSVVNYLFYAERTGRLSMVSGSVAVVGCGVSFALTSAFGLQGAGASFLINTVLLFILVWMAAARAVPMPWMLWRR